MKKEKNFPAPKDDPEFKKYWDKYLPKILTRENFHEVHLDQLSILCDLYIEYENLTEFVKDKGYTYESDGRYGESFKEWPEIKIRQKVVSELRQYAKALDLVLNKDMDKKAKETKSEWD